VEDMRLKFEAREGLRRKGKNAEDSVGRRCDRHPNSEEVSFNDPKERPRSRKPKACEGVLQEMDCWGGEARLAKRKGTG